MPLSYEHPTQEQQQNFLGKCYYNMWMSLGSTPENLAPSSRAKHSATLLGNSVYLFGGKNGNLPLKDFWEYNIVEGKWKKLEPKGDRPPCLQEHTAVAFKESIYVFGGEVGFSAGTETPLWVYNTKNNYWKKIRGQKGVLNPKGRRGHTALVYKGSMIIYGGYQDLRGSSSELWGYHFETETWHLLSPKPSTDSLQRPSGRHKHSAVLHDGAMWVYGGMTDLQEKGDLWRWDIASKLWYNIKTKTNPGCLHSHAVCKLPSSMLVFGGETNGQLSNDLWRFHFGTEVWEKLQFPGNKPHPRAESIAFTVFEVHLKDKPNCNSNFTVTHLLSEHNVSSKNNFHSLGNRNKSFCQNKVDSAEKKYVFNDCAKHCTTGSLMANMVHNNNLNFLKEISKLSSFNLSRLNHKCSYSMLNSSHDSTESLLKGKDGSDSEHTPTRMVKSQSANIITNNDKKKTTFSTLTPATDKMPYSIAESANFFSSESERPSKSTMPRELVSVPNLNNCPTNSEKHIDTSTSKLGFVDAEENELDNYKSRKVNIANINNHNNNNNSNNYKKINPNDNNKINLPGTPFPKEDKVFEPKNKNNDNYSFSKKCQSDSYSSHLVTLGNEENTEWNSGIPKSASVVRFKKQIEIADELTSDYCSIETVNKISSSSNYSQSPADTHKDLINDYPELKFGRSTESFIKKNSRDITYGFSNPNYLGPEVQAILKPKNMRNYGKILNSPPDSVLEDTNKTMTKQPTENLEMKSMSSNKIKQIEFKLPKEVRSPPKYLPLRGNPYNTTTVPIYTEKRKKSRASSASRLERRDPLIEQNINEELSSIQLNPKVPLSMFLIGGKEHGHVTVFKRPISFWKLQLTSNVY